jgi:hypothetical protein
MRRHDMLQEGSATMLPVPADELEILGMEIYTFGGPNFAGQAGTASGANNWKNLADKAGLTGSANTDGKFTAPTSIPGYAKGITNPNSSSVTKGKGALRY